MQKLKVQLNKASRLTSLGSKIAISKTVYKRDDAYIGKITYETLKDLGPTFVKIGQFISTRSDIFGKSFTDQLKGLQDNVTPMSNSDLKSILETQSSITDVVDIDINPIAAASIGQVHLGKLANSTPVAVKIKRRFIDETINDDFKMLLFFVDLTKMMVSSRQISEVEISLREYYALLLEEIDFNKEVSNMLTFANQFKNVKWIKVPKPYTDLCNNDVIVMEYVPSIKIDDTQALVKYDQRMISNKLIECFFAQIIEHGFVHIDPHPGNVGMMADGKIVFYDYGMFVKLDGVMKQNLKTLFLTIYDRDVEEVCKLLVEMEIIIVEPGKMIYFQRFVASFLTYIDNLDVENFKLSYIDKIDTSEMQFQIASKFILLLRGFSILEGVCRKLDSDFTYREVMDPYISDFIMDMDYMERRGKRDIQRFTGAPDKITSSEISINLVESDVTNLKKRLESSENKTRYAILGALALLEVQGTLTLETRLFFAVAFLYVLINK